MRNIITIGGGGWGTALALTACRASADNTVKLLVRTKDKAKEIQRTHRNTSCFPDISLPKRLKITADISALKETDLVLLAVPAQTVRQNCQQYKETLPPSTPVVICSKGIETTDTLLLSQVIHQELPNPIVILSGPNFADEVALNKPTATTIAADAPALSKDVADALRHPYFRCYTSSDLIGVQIAGALKNVIAIACGIVRGKEIGHNATAAVMTRGLVEIKRLIVAMGGKPETLLGLSGVGDLTLTCTSRRSRNTALGIAIGACGSVQTAFSKGSKLCEGVYTTAAVHKLAQSNSVDMPIVTAVNDILHFGKNVEEVITHMLSTQAHFED